MKSTQKIFRGISGLIYTDLRVYNTLTSRHTRTFCFFFWTFCSFIVCALRSLRKCLNSIHLEEGLTNPDERLPHHEEGLTNPDERLPHHEEGLTNPDERLPHH